MKSRPSAFVVFILVLVVICPAAFATTGVNAVPLINQPLVPTAAIPGGAGFTLTVNGTAFVSGSTVNWNGSPRTTTFISSSQLTAQIAATDIATETTATITVSSPAPGGGTSNPVFFQVTNATSSVAYSASSVAVGVTTSNPGRQVVAADFNHDGALDFATQNADNTVSVVLGNGNGTFQLPVIYAATPAGTTAQGLIVGDFNNDGIADLAVAYSGGGTSGIAVLAGNGNGTFQTAVTTTTANVLTGVLAAGDLNADGNLDIVAGCDTTVCILLGAGNGTFTASNLGTDFTETVQSVAVGDFNGDGNTDIAATSTLGGISFAAVVLGNGDGTFGTPTTIDTPVANGSFGSVALADVNGDGILDVVYYYMACSPACGGNLDVLEGVGDGTFQAPLTTSGLAGATGLVPIPGDYNGDGILDVTVGDVVLLGLGNATFANNPVLLPQFATVAGDFNNDGMLDFASPNGTGVYIQLELPGNFTGYASPTSQTVVAGANAGYTLHIVPLNGYLGTVTITNGTLPTGVTAVYQPTNTIANSNGSVSLTLVVSGTTTPGTYPITLTATSGAISHSATITLVVNQQAGDFTGSLVPSGITIGPGEVASSTITVIPINGFTGNVSLSVTGTPAGATALFTPAVVTGGSGPSVLSISTSPTTPLGKYVLTLTGTSGSISHSTTLILSIASNADFTGTISPSSAAVVPGGRASFTATVIPLNGFNGNVTVTASGLPAGATATVTPATVMHGSGSASVVITTTGSTPIGSYAITLTGTCGTLVHATNVTLNVNSTPGDFGASISPTSQTVSVSAGNFASYGITLFPVNGFTGNVTLSASGVPAGATAAFNPSNVVTGGSGSATLVITTTNTLVPGTYTIDITGKSGTITHTAAVTLVVNP